MNSLKILLIDDDCLSLKSMERALTLNGFEVSCFSDPVLAIDVFHKNPFHVVMTDLKMKAIDGIKIIRIVKSVSPYVTTILFSGFLTDDNFKEAMDKGADLIYSKPIPLKEIINKLKKLEKGACYE
jgi:DNA-binding NtrC family response regulator